MISQEYESPKISDFSIPNVMGACASGPGAAPDCTHGADADNCTNGNVAITGRCAAGPTQQGSDCLSGTAA